MKPFKNIDEQISLLKSRGLIINDETRARELLYRSNYYDLVNGYSKTLKNPDNDNYLAGVSFDDLYGVYSFDKNIKSVFYRKISKVEAFMRASVAYVFSEHHPENFAYLNISHFEGDQLKIAKFLAKLSGVIKYNEKAGSVKHYIEKYDCVPLWVLINYLSLGQLISFFKYMKEVEKAIVCKKISEYMKKYYNFTEPVHTEHIESFLKNINDVRNVVAHDDRLVCYKCIKHVKYNSEIFDEYNITKLSDRNTVYCTMIVMKCFLTSGQYADFVKALKNKIKDLDRQLKKSASGITVNDILKDFGMPDNWHLS